MASEVSDTSNIVINVFTRAAFASRFTIEITEIREHLMCRRHSATSTPGLSTSYRLEHRVSAPLDVDSGVQQHDVGQTGNDVAQAGVEGVR